jgi:hypothetical protein
MPEENTSNMINWKLLPVSTCYIWLVLLIPFNAQSQCEFIIRDIENVRSNAMEVLRLSDTLEVFVSAVEKTRQYGTARSNTRKAQIYSGEILAATYRAVAMATEAQQRVGACGIEEMEGSVANAASYAFRAQDLADEAFTYAKRAYGSRNLETIQKYLQKSLEATREAQKAATSLAHAASEAHFSMKPSPEAIVAAGKG